MKGSLRVGGIAALVQVLLTIAVPIVLTRLEQWGYAGDFYNLANWPEGFQPLLVITLIQFSVGISLLLMVFALYDLLQAEAPHLMRFSMTLAAIGCTGALLSGSIVADISKLKQHVPAELQMSTLYASWTVVYPGARHALFLGLSLSAIGWSLAGLRTKKLPTWLCILALIGAVGGILDGFTTGTLVMPVRAIFLLHSVAAAWLGVLLLRRAAVPLAHPGTAVLQNS